MATNDTFIEKCLRGDSSPNEIDDYIDQWHEGTSNQPLYAFLGMTGEEYQAWVGKSDILLAILNARRSVST